MEEEGVKLQGSTKEEQSGQPWKLVPGSHIHVGEEAQNKDSAQGTGEVQGTHPGDNQAQQGNQHGTKDRSTKHLPPGLDGVLPLSGHQERH